MAVRTRKAASVRRDEILAGTVALIAERGLAGTVTRDVTERLGVSTGLLHHHFTTWAGLRAEALRVIALREHAAAFAAVEDAPDDRALALLLTRVLPDGPDETWWLWVEAWTEARADPAIAQVCRDVLRRWQGGLCRLIGRGVTVGAFRCEDLDATAWRIMAAIDGFTGFLTGPVDALDHRRATDMLLDLAAREVGMVRWHLDR